MTSSESPVEFSETLPADEDEVTMSVRVTIPGEGVYNLNYTTHRDGMAIKPKDWVDMHIETMTRGVRKFRSIRVHGQCVREGCGLPVVPAPLSSENGLCQPHDYQRYRLGLEPTL
jgi:hypothetical protein